MTKEFHCRESKPMAESPMPQKYVKNLATSQTMKNRKTAAVGFPNIERAPPIHPAVFFFLSQLSAVWPARFIQKKAHIWPFSHKVWSIGLVPLRNINKKKTPVAPWFMAFHLNHPQEVYGGTPMCDSPLPGLIVGFVQL